MTRHTTLPVGAFLAALVAAALVVPSAGLAAEDAPEPVRPAFGDVDSPIRPGSSISTCTLNFVFYDEVYATEEDPDPDVPAYIGTAAHCTSEVGQRVSVPGVGEIGTVVYDSDEVGSSVDFSLVQLDDDKVSQTNPTMRGWDGPHGSVTVDELSAGDRVDIYGYGMVVRTFEETRPRFGVLMSWDDDEYVVNGPIVNGDSGAPLLHHDTGHALGIISRWGFFATPPSTDEGPMMPWILRELDDAGFDVLLATVADGA